MLRDHFRGIASNDFPRGTHNHDLWGFLFADAVYCHERPIVMAHGGDYLPFYTDRHDFTYLGGHHPQLKGNVSSYLPPLYYDTVLFNPDMEEFLATKVPVSHILLASDYPFAERRPVEFIRRAKKISKKARDAVLGANCAKLLGNEI